MMATEDGLQPSSDSFWEVDCYKRTVKRQDDGHKLCSELMQLITDRGHIEKEYAKSLKGWSKKWTDLIDKGPEYGTSEAACKAVMSEADSVAELHLEVRERLVNDVHNAIKTWRTENYHKSMVGPCKETKELDDGFKKAQKPWAKRYQAVLSARKAYHRAEKALLAAQQQSDDLLNDQSDTASVRSLSFAQKPWAKRYSKVMKARKDYHTAVKQEKTATNQENNSKNDSSVSPDALKKAQERVEKSRREVESTKQKYEEALRDINAYNPKYMEDMSEVFSKCQAQEEKRLKFFKEMLFGIHKCLDLSVNPAYGNIYVTLKAEIGTADAARDLKYWSEHHGVDMSMNWPIFEEYSEQMNEISKKKMSDSDRGTVTLRKIRYHEEFTEYAPEPHTISRKEKKGASEGITLTSVKQSETPTHVPAQPQGYSNYSADDQTPPPSASSHISQNRPLPPVPPPKPVARKQESYDPSLNPFTDEPDIEPEQYQLLETVTTETAATAPPIPSPRQSGSRLSVNSASAMSQRSESTSSIDWTNPFKEDLDDEVLIIPRPNLPINLSLTEMFDRAAGSSKQKAEKSKKRNSTTSEPAPTTQQLSVEEQEDGTRRQSVHSEPGVAADQLRSTSSSSYGSACADNSSSSVVATADPTTTTNVVDKLVHSSSRKGLAPRAPPSNKNYTKSAAYDPGLNPFGDEDEGGQDNVSKRSSTNNGSAALQEWEDGPSNGMEETMRIPVRALYDYNGQEEDELSFKSGDVFIKLKDEDDQGWCVGEKDGNIGLYPRDYVEVI